jgi:hypothetical protein
VGVARDPVEGEGTEGEGESRRTDLLRRRDRGNCQGLESDLGMVNWGRVLESRPMELDLERVRKDIVASWRCIGGATRCLATL